MDHWDFATGMLLPGEKVIIVQQHVRLYNGDEKILLFNTKTDTGRVSLTTHRLLWETPSLKACFYLQKANKLDKEGKNFFSGKSPKICIHVFSPTQSNAPVASPFVSEKQATYFKLAFTQGGLEDFLVKLTDVLRQREWEKKPPKAEPKRRLGILGIERDLKDESRKTNQQISEAFQDLKSLVEMAKPMVQIAKKISEKASKQATASGPASKEAEDASKFRKQLLSLGIEDPVTKETYTNKHEYHLHLAMELCEVLGGEVLASGGMMTLVEAYCRLNRARGIHVISPHDMMSACQTLQKVPNATLNLVEFGTNIKVLQHQTYDDDIVVGQILSLLEGRESLTSEEYANEARVPLFIGKHGMLMAEARGSLCRDDSIEGLRFYPNLFLNYDNDGGDDGPEN